MTALLDRLGHPERGYDAVHVVGTKGKSTAARTIAALLRAEGRASAAYTSPHVAGWGERLETDAEGFEQAVARVRPDAEAVGATQFEVLTAAAFADFAARGVDVAVVEAGLGGRLDATNVLDAGVVLLTNVGLEHTEVLGETRGEIAREKLAVAHEGAVVVLPDEEFAPLVAGHEVRLGGARTAAEAYLGHPTTAEVQVALAGRLELRDGEVRDGAHTPEAVDWLLERLPRPHDYVVVASILADKDADAILDRLARAGRDADRDPLVERARAARGGGRGPRDGLRRGRGSARAGGRSRPGEGARAARPRHRLALPACRSVGNGLKCIRCRALVAVSASSSSPSGCSPSSSGSRSRRVTR